MSLIKKLAGQTVVYGLSTMLGRLINYLLVPIHTAVFYKADFGAFSQLYAFLGFIYVFFSLRMTTSLFRFSNKEGEDKAQVASTSFSFVTILAIVASLLCGAFYQQVAAFLELSDRPYLVLLMVGIVLFDALCEVPFALLRLEGKALKFASFKLINVGVNVAFNLVFLGYAFWVTSTKMEGFSIGYVLVANMAASGVTFLLLLTTIRQYSFGIDKALLKRMLIYAAPLVLVSVATMVNEVLDRILLIELLPGTIEERRGEVGVYSACYKLAIFITMFSNAFQYAAEPFFFKNAGHKSSKSVYGIIANYFMIVCVLCFIGILIYLDIFKLFIAEEYRVGLTVVPILLMANIGLGLYYNLAAWYKLADKTIYGLYLSLVGAALTIGINVLFIPTYGYEASAWATLAAYGSMCVVSYILCRRIYPIDYPVVRMLFYIAMGVGSYLGFQYLDGASLHVLIRWVYLLPFLAVVFLLERKEFMSFLKIN